MPLDGERISSAKWMKRARSSLALAKVDKPPETVLEDLCFHAQQAAEKALKAVLLHRNIQFRYVHDLNELMATLEEHGVDIPRKVQAAVELNEYAVEARYPGDYEPVGEEEYFSAIAMAETVVGWAQSVIQQALGCG